MSRMGFSTKYNYYFVYNCDSDGQVNHYDLNNELSLRPTFYLSSETKLSGEGTLSNPFKIDY